MLLTMTHRAEAYLLDSHDLRATLGEFESVTEARAACNKHEGGTLSWSQPWEGLWEAYGAKRWYRVITSL